MGLITVAPARSVWSLLCLICFLQQHCYFLLQASKRSPLALQKCLSQATFLLTSGGRQNIGVSQIIGASPEVVGLDPTLVNQNAQTVIKLAQADAGTLSRAVLVGRGLSH